MKKKILSIILVLALLLSAFATTVSAVVQKPVYTEGGTVEGKEDAFAAIDAELSEYQHGETVALESDGYIGIPVDITAYNDPSVEYTPTVRDEMEYPYDTTEPNYTQYETSIPGGKPVILYVINTNTVRYGTDSDVSIIRDFLAEGYTVFVLDYKNEKRSATPDLDWSLATLRNEIESFSGDLPVWTALAYVIPAGYTMKRGIQYFNFEENGADGVLDFFVDVWNVDLKYTGAPYGKGDRASVVWGQKELYDGTLVYQDAEGNRCIPKGSGYAYYVQNEDYSYTVTEAVADPSTVTPLYKSVTDDAVWIDEEARTIKVRYTNAEDWWDCVKPSGERIDLNLYMDICYPTNPEYEVPLMARASSNQCRSKSSNPRPIDIGYTFTGYATANYDHAHVPMARADHFDYFEGDAELGRDANFTVVNQTGVQAQTAAIRMLRYLAERYPETFCYDVDRFGVWGHSKGAHVNFFAADNPELVPNEDNFPGHKGEVTKEQPWLTYSDGSAIPSNVQLIYSSKGGDGGYANQNGTVPFYLSHPEADTLLSENARYSFMLATMRATNTPSFAVTMEGAGHTTVHGYNEELDLDMYQSLFDFTDYFLYDRPSTCSYILPINGTTNVSLSDDIIIKFTGPIPESEILSKVKVINTATGESVRGTWENAYGGNEWTFTPMGLEGGTVYRILVPEDVIDAKGHAIKAPKSTYFRTSYETAFKAAEVVSTNGSLTLSRTESGENGVYFIFEPTAVEHSFGATLRFSSTANASTSLRVFGVSSLDESNVLASTLCSEPIATVGVAGAEIVEVDVSEYLASLSEGAKPVFYVEAAKTAGETVIYDLDFENGSGPISASKIATSPNGTKAYRIKTGSSAFLTRIFSNVPLTEADYGRQITVSFDVCCTVDKDFYARFTLEKVIVPEGDVKGYVDNYNDAAVSINLKAGEWRTVTLTYLIDDYDYVADWIQKRALNLSTSSKTIEGEYVYVDNLRVVETVADATISDRDSQISIAPTLAFKSAELTEQSIVGGGYVTNGEYSDTAFGAENGYLVSGLASGAGDMRVSYIEIDLNQLNQATPYALVLDILKGNGKINFYGLNAQAMEDFRISELTYLNAPAIDRVMSTINTEDVWGNAPLATRSVSVGSTVTVGLSRYLLDMKAEGQSRAVIVIALDPSTSTTIELALNDGTITRVLNTINFNEMDSFTSTNSRYEVKDNTGAFLQKPNTADTATAALDESVFYGESGKSLKISNNADTSHGTPNSFTTRILKFLNKDPNQPVFTEADVGKTYYVSMKLYIPSLEPYGSSLKYVGIGMTSVSKNKVDGVTSYYGTNTTQMYNYKALSALSTNLTTGEWIDIVYPFTVHEHMLGTTPSTYSNDTRPINFSLIGTRGDVYVDDLCFYTIETSEQKDFLPVAAAEVEFTSKGDVNTFVAKGGDTTYEFSPLEEANDAYALKVGSQYTYDRLYLRGILEQFGMQEENVGDTYSFVIRMMANKAGTFMVDISNRQDSARIPTDSGTVARNTYTITEQEVGQWIDFEYTFTLTQTTLDFYNAKKGETVAGITLSCDGSDKFGLCLRMNGFAQNADSPLQVYIDYVKCYQNAPVDDGDQLIAPSLATVSKTDGTLSDLSVSLAKSDGSTLRKSYFAYTPSTLKNMRGATITVRASRFFSGEILYLWALKGVTMPELLTWNTAPANTENEALQTSYIYGEGPIASFTLDENGTAVIDVFDYVQNADTDELIFVVTSEGGAKVHMQLNLSEVESIEDVNATSDGTLTLANGALSTDGTSITFSNVFARETLSSGEALSLQITVDTDKEYTLTVDGTNLSYTMNAKSGALRFTIEAEEQISLSTLTLTAKEAGFAILAAELSEPYLSVLEAPTLSLYTASDPTPTFEGVVAGHNVVITDTLTYKVYLSMDKNVASVEVADVRYAFDQLPEKQFGDTTYKCLSITTVAKNAFSIHSITITLTDGSRAVYDLNIRHYLEQLYSIGESDAEKTLAADMLSYLAASIAYFYSGVDEGRVNGAIAVRNHVIGKDYDAQNAPSGLANASPAVPTDSGMDGAGMNLAERPTFYFVAAKGYENASPVFTMDGETLAYTTAIEGERTIFYLSFSPTNLTKTVTWTIGDKSGAFNLRAFYDYATDVAKDESLATLVERLYRYSESVQSYFA